MSLRHGEGVIIHARDESAQSALDRFLFADLLFTLVLAPLAYGTVEAWSVALFELNALLLALLVGLKIVRSGEFRFHRLMLPLGAGLLYGALQIAVSLDQYATRQAVVKALALAIYFVVALQTIRGRERLRRLLIVVTCLGFGLALFAILQKLTWNGKLYWVRPLESGTPFGPFVNYNHFAGLMEMLFPLPCAYMLFGGVGRERRGMWFFVAMFMAVSIVVSLSRAGLLVLGIEIIAFWVVSHRLRRQARQPGIPRVSGALLLVATAMLAAWISYDQIAARWGASGGLGGEFTATGRGGMWRDSWRMFLDHPLTGVGFGAYPAVYPSYGWSSAYRERLEQAHNDYLQLLTDGGLIGGLIGLWFLLELILLARRHWLRTRAGVAGSRLENSLIVGSLIGLLGLLSHSFTDFNLQITSNALLFLLLAAIAAAGESGRPARLTAKH